MIIQWARFIDGSQNDEGNGIAVDTTGNVYITGNTNTPGLQITTASGTVTRLSDIEIVFDDSGTIITPPNNEGTFVIKYNSAGICQWAQFIDGSSNDIGRGIAVDTAGNVYVAGHTDTPEFQIPTASGTVTKPSDSMGAFIVKYNSAGICQWAQFIDGSSFEIGLGIAVDITGNVYVTGHTDTPGFQISTASGTVTKPSDSFGGFIVKYNSAGICQWAKFIDGSSFESVSSITTDIDGNAYIIGHTDTPGFQISTASGTVTKPSDSFGAFIAKYNSAGICQWAQFIDGSSNEFGIGITVDTVGNTYITGHTDTPGFQISTASGTVTKPSNNLGTFIVKYNSVGICQWAQFIDGSSNENANAIVIDTYGNVYVTGGTDTPGFQISTASGTVTKPSNNLGTFIVKYNSVGICQWAQFIDGSSNESVKAIAVDTSGNIYVTGYTNTPGFQISTISGTVTKPSDNLGAFIIKYISIPALTGINTSSSVDVYIPSTTGNTYTIYRGTSVATSTSTRPFTQHANNLAIVPSYPMPSEAWGRVLCDSTGQYVMIITQPTTYGYIYISNNYGNNSVYDTSDSIGITLYQQWVSSLFIESAGTATLYAVTADTSYIYKRVYTLSTSAPDTNKWIKVTTSGLPVGSTWVSLSDSYWTDFSKNVLFALVSSSSRNLLYVSTDDGITWSFIDSPSLSSGYSWREMTNKTTDRMYLILIGVGSPWELVYTNSAFTLASINVLSTIEHFNVSAYTQTITLRPPQLQPFTVILPVIYVRTINNGSGSEPFVIRQYNLNPPSYNSWAVRIVSRLPSICLGIVSNPQFYVYVYAYNNINYVVINGLLTPYTYQYQYPNTNSNNPVYLTNNGRVYISGTATSSGLSHPYIYSYDTLERYNDTSVTSGTTYSYDYTITPSGGVPSVRSTTLIQTYVAPPTISSVQYVNNTIQIAWAYTEPVDSFRIQRVSLNNNIVDVFDSIPSANRLYTDTSNIFQNYAYSYGIYAIRGGTPSALSDLVYYTPPPATAFNLISSSDVYIPCNNVGNTYTVYRDNQSIGSFVSATLNMQVGSDYTIVDSTYPQFKWGRTVTDATGQFVFVLDQIFNTSRSGYIYTSNNYGVLFSYDTTDIDNDSMIQSWRQVLVVEDAQGTQANLYAITYSRATDGEFYIYKRSYTLSALAPNTSKWTKTKVAGIPSGSLIISLSHSYWTALSTTVLFALVNLSERNYLYYYITEGTSWILIDSMSLPTNYSWRTFTSGTTNEMYLLLLETNSIWQLSYANTFILSAISTIPSLLYTTLAVTTLPPSSDTSLFFGNASTIWKWTRSTNTYSIFHTGSPPGEDILNIQCSRNAEYFSIVTTNAFVLYQNYPTIIYSENTTGNTYRWIQLTQSGGMYDAQTTATGNTALYSTGLLNTYTDTSPIASVTVSYTYTITPSDSIASRQSLSFPWMFLTPPFISQLQNEDNVITFDWTYSDTTINSFILYRQISDGYNVYSVLSSLREYLDTRDLITGSFHQYALRSIKGIYMSAIGNLANDTVPSIYYIPSPICENSANGIQIAVLAITGLTPSKIYRDGTQLATLTTPVSSYTDTTVSYGTSYMYRIEYTDASSLLTQSSILTIPYIEPPVLTSLDTKNQGIILQWTFSSTADSFSIFRNNVSIVTSVTDLTYTDTSNLVAGTKYTYTVKGRINGTDSFFSNSLYTYYIPSPTYTFLQSAIRINIASYTDLTRKYIYRDGGQIATLNPSDPPYYDDLNRVNNTTYIYTIGYEDSSEQLIKSDERTVLFVVPPTGLNFVLNVGSVFLTWSAVPFATSYTVIRVDNSSPPVTTTYSAPFNFYTDESIEYGKLYTYTVKTVVGSYVSVPSNPVYITNLELTPPNITNKQSYINIYLTPYSSATEYRIYRNGSNTPLTLPTYDSNYLDYNVVAGTTYTYQYSVVVGGSETNKSAGISRMYLDAPTDIIISNPSSSQSLQLQWTPANFATSYKVYRTNNNGDVSVYTAPSNVYEDTGDIINGYQYKYQVSSVAETSESVLTNYNKSLFLQNPAIENNGNYIRLSWTNIDSTSPINTSTNPIFGYVIYKNNNFYDFLYYYEQSSSIEYNDDKVSSGTVYTYSVNIIQYDGTIYIMGSNTTRYMRYPENIQNIQAGREVIVSWNPVTNAIQYSVGYNTIGSGGGGWQNGIITTNTSYTTTNEDTFRVFKRYVWAIGNNVTSAEIVQF